jgi:hypothetical protein
MDAMGLVDPMQRAENVEAELVRIAAKRHAPRDDGWRDRLWEAGVDA